MPIKSWRTIAVMWAIGLFLAITALFATRRIASWNAAEFEREADVLSRARGVDPTQVRGVIGLALTPAQAERSRRQLRRMRLIDTAGGLVAIAILVALIAATGVWVWSFIYST